MIDDRKIMMDLGDSTSEVAAHARNLSPIVPRGSISGRALIAVVAIMTYLASVNESETITDAKAFYGIRSCGCRPNAVSASPSVMSERS